MKQVITISREFGSGGRELGFQLAEKWKVPFYDKELISMASDVSDVLETIIHDYDERVPDLMDRSRYKPFSSVYQLPMSDQIFLYQSRIIRTLAARGPCVIVGRCADMVLEDSINIFVYAKMKKRVERMLALELDSDPAQMEARIREVDKKRKDYYQHYTGNTWGRAQNYDLCLDSGRAGIEGCLKTVVTYVAAAEKRK